PCADFARHEIGWIGLEVFAPRVGVHAIPTQAWMNYAMERGPEGSAGAAQGWIEIDSIDEAGIRGQYDTRNLLARVSGVFDAAFCEGVGDLAIGDRVFGILLFGGYASRVSVPRAQLWRIPDGLDMNQAAGMPAVYLTAYYALYELVRLRSRMSLLIHSAAGGV